MSEIEAESSKRPLSPTQDGPSPKKQALEPAGPGNQEKGDRTQNKKKGRDSVPARKLRERTPNKSTEGNTVGEDGEGKKRLPKKKAAIMLGYCGTGYSGMQMCVMAPYLLRMRKHRTIQSHEPEGTLQSSSQSDARVTYD